MTAPDAMTAQHVGPQAPAVAVPASSNAGAQSASSRAVPTWQGELLARLQQAKRYPEDARLRREEGVAYLRIVISRDGLVEMAEVERSSGHAALDDEAAAMARRASPLPPPPVEVRGDPVMILVPVRFSLR